MEESTNPYLALRAQNIARNQARLKELGLIGGGARQQHSSSRRRRSPKKKQQPSVLEKVHTLRRSPRHTGRPTTYLELPEPKRQKSVSRVDVHIGAQDDDDTNSSLVTATSTTSFPPHSARAMEISVAAIVENLLGVPVKQTGKAHVMHESAQTCLDSPAHCPHTISFNKYSGVQEWKNDAMFLWVNLGGSGDVVNEFLNNARQITWFGGSRMHDQSNVIRRLLRVGKAAANGTLEPEDGLLLWCRTYDSTKKTFTPYVCLGRLSYHSHVPGSRPLEFVWNLMDRDRLVQNDYVQGMFQDFAM